MTNVIAPNGFTPMRRIDGAMANFTLTPYRIQTAYATSIFYGDPVAQVGGYITVSTGTDQFRGVFQGCEYTTAAGVRVKSPYWPASTSLFTGTFATAFVIDDPNVVFAAQANNTATQSTLTDFGRTMSTTIGSGSTLTGISTSALNYSTINTTLLQWRVLKYVDRIDLDNTSTTDFNTWFEVVPLKHDLRTQLGQS